MKKVVIGIGNPLKGDDNIGNIIVDKLKKEVRNPNYFFIRAETNPENFMGKVRSFEPGFIYFIDAVDFSGEIGEVKVFSIEDVLNKSLSTHGLSVNIYRDFFPDTEIKIIGIKVENIDYGEGLQDEIKDKLSSITKKILALL
jgi:hydrogenase 3 maturation protease